MHSQLVEANKWAENKPSSLLKMSQPQRKSFLDVVLNPSPELNTWTTEPGSDVVATVVSTDKTPVVSPWAKEKTKRKRACVTW